MMKILWHRRPPGRLRISLRLQIVRCPLVAAVEWEDSDRNHLHHVVDLLLLLTDTTVDRRRSQAHHPVMVVFREALVSNI